MRRFLRRFFRYYKWHLFFSLLVLICILFVYSNMTSQIEPDLTFGYVGSHYINTQSFVDYKAELELLLKDANGDGKKLAAITASTGDLQRDIDEVFKEMVESENYDIYVASKETFENYEDKSAFSSSESYIVFDEEKFDTLKDSDDRIYAVSLEDNTLAKRLGFLNTEGLYISVAEVKDKPLTDFKKNGRNITGYIIDNKAKYTQ